MQWRLSHAPRSFLRLLLLGTEKSPHQPSEWKSEAALNWNSKPACTCNRPYFQGQITAMVLIDLSKAFDSLCNLTLLSKLYQLGTSNKALQWFHSYLTNREQCTRVGTSLLEPLMVTHGVPQGWIPGPMLFSLNMTDLPGVTKFSNIELYMDDTKIYLLSSAQDIHSHLEQIS